MALTSTLFTGLSGLDVNQTKLNVTGNNIANVNTVAFKASRALFKPQFYVTDNAGSPASADFGGENPSQRGLGAVVASIQKDFQPGAIEATGKSTDMAIDGDGFFVVQGKEQKYTRDGSFSLNQNNELVTTAGDFVQGFGVDANGNVIAGQLDKIEIPLGSLTQAKATENAKFQGNLDADGAKATGASNLLSNHSFIDTTTPGVPPDPTTSLLVNLQDTTSGASPFAAGDVLTLQGSRGGRELSTLTYTIDGTSTLQNLFDFYNQGLDIDTTVTTSNAPGATVQADPLNADASYLSIIGNTGTDNAISLSGAGFTSNNPNLAFSFGESGTPSGESVYTSFQVFDSLGTPLNISVTATLEDKTNTGTTWRFYATTPDDTDAGAFDPAAVLHQGSIVGNGTLSFDNDGKLTGTTGASILIDRANTGAKTPFTVALDFSGMTGLTSSNGTKSQLLMSSQDGLAMGTLTNFSVGANGLVTGAFDNGLTRTLGQVAIATFDNQEGLVDKGGNMYVTGANSGVPKITGPLTLTAGSIRAGSLEASNVDLSKEFINMIIASTGFSAASRVITTSDQLLTELLNTSR
jgi:flagellar hook protein FlgE